MITKQSAKSASAYEKFFAQIFDRTIARVFRIDITGYFGQQRRDRSRAYAHVAVFVYNRKNFNESHYSVKRRLVVFLRVVQSFETSYQAL